MKQTAILTHATHVNDWFPAVYMSCMSQNCRLFHVSNLSVSKLSNFSAHVYGVTVAAPQRWWPVGSLECRRGMWNGAHVTCQNRPPAQAQTQTQSRRSDRGVGRPSSRRSPGILYRVQAERSNARFRRKMAALSP